MDNRYRNLIDKIEGKPKIPPRSFPDILHRSYHHRYARLCKQLAERAAVDTNQAAKFITDDIESRMSKLVADRRLIKRLES